MRYVQNTQHYGLMGNNMLTTQRTLFILLFISAFATLTGAYIPLLSPFYDSWIPQISGYALIHDLQPHSDFFSPFGLLYHQLNGFSYSLINTLPTLLQPFDIITLNSIITAGCIGLLALAIRYDLAIPGLAILLITATALQVRPIATVEAFFDPASFSWSGTYNNILWSAILLQSAGLFTATTHPITVHRLPRIALWNALIVFITFHSKINFFAASSLLSLSYLSILPPSSYVRFICYGTLSLVCMIVAYSSYYHYAYMPYIEAVWQAYMSKQAIGDLAITTKPQALLLTLCLIATYIVSMSMLRQAASWPFSRLRTLFFDSCIIGAIMAVIIGDTHYPSGYIQIFTVLILYGTITNHALCNWIIYAVVTLHLSALALFAVEKQRPEGITRPMHEVLLHSPYHTWHFKIPPEKGLSDLYKILPSSQPEHWVKQSYSYRPAHHRWRLPHGNYEYIQMMNEATYYSAKTPPHSRLFFLGFANPLPLLLHRQPRHYQPHWLDAFITFHPEHLDFLSPILAETDWLYMPILTTDQLTNPTIQTHLNCAFYRWNQQHDRFVLNHISPYGLIFVEKHQANSTPLPLPPAFSIMNHCQQVANVVTSYFGLSRERSEPTHA